MFRLAVAKDNLTPFRRYHFPLRRAFLDRFSRDPVSSLLLPPLRYRPRDMAVTFDLASFKGLEYHSFGFAWVNSWKRGSKISDREIYGY